MHCTLESAICSCWNILICGHTTKHLNLIHCSDSKNTLMIFFNEAFANPGPRL